MTSWWHYRDKNNIFLHTLIDIKHHKVVLPHHQFARPLVPVRPARVAGPLEEHLPKGRGVGHRRACYISQAGVCVLLSLRRLRLALGYKHHGDRVVGRAGFSRRERKLPLNIAVIKTLVLFKHSINRKLVVKWTVDHICNSICGVSHGSHLEPSLYLHLLSYTRVAPYTIFRTT